MKLERPRSLVSRSVALALCAGQLLIAVPPQVLAAQPEDAEQTRPGPPSVNRTVPDAEPAPARPLFSSSPTDDEITESGVFEQPLVPMPGVPEAGENGALSTAILGYSSGGSEEGTEAFEAFLKAYPSSRWRMSLLTSLGYVYRRYGRFTRALSALDEAWRLGAEAQDYDLRVRAELAAAEFADISARFVRQKSLQELLGSTIGREWTAPAAERMAVAHHRLAAIVRSPRNGFRCGPMAIESLLSFGSADYTRDPRMQRCMDTQTGVSLAQVSALATDLGRSLQMAKREPGAAIPVPAVVHWKLDHFSALVETDGRRYLVHDVNLGDFWVSARALDAESTGYFLIPNGELAPGWRPVGQKEAAQVVSNCVTFNANPTKKSAITCSGNKVGTLCGEGGGMAVWAVHPMMVNLNITDVPLSYTPPIGPKVEFRVTYNQRSLVGTQNFANVGPSWSTDWVAWINDSTNPTVIVNVPGGGTTTYTGIAATLPASSAPEPDTQVVLVKVSASRYERRFPDGSLQVFDQPGTELAPFKKFFMTQWIDPQGNGLTFTYDPSLMRLLSVTDAIGQVTQLFYDQPYPNNDLRRITRVVDPFQRTALLEYSSTASGDPLTKITDTIGVTSEFTYNPGINWLDSMTTPYGKTRFIVWDPIASGHIGEVGSQRLDIVDPTGGIQRVEYWDAPGAPSSEATGPAGMNIVNTGLQYRNSFYWDQRAMALYPGDYSKAKVFHWALDAAGAVNDVPASTKLPLENRVWYNYTGQTTADTAGTINQPSAAGRVLDDGSSQVFKNEYNTLGNVTKATDPAGRETVYEYDTNQIDLLRVKQKNGAGYDLLASHTYNALHEPLTSVDAAGQTTTFTYNTRGQVLTARNAKNEQWAFDYSVPDGYLQTITGPLPGSVVTVQWDGYGRPWKITNFENYTVTLNYDTFNRLTRLSYPDGTYEQLVYDRMHPQKYRDLLGRWTEVLVDALRRPTSIRDPQGRTTTLSWCDCGSLEKLIDPEGHVTSWERDLQSRVTKEIQADSTFKVFAYENTTSRLKTATDARTQTRNYSYFVDNRLQQVTYTNAGVPTPGVSFAYDPVFGRLSSRTDGTGTTSYAYNAITGSPVLGAGRLAGIDGPLTNDLVAYSYDELGRPLSRSINGSAVSVQYDALSRVTSVTNPLGSFGYGYDGLTTRLKTVTYPTGLTRTYNYFPEAQDHRLQEIRNEKPGGVNVSRFGYTQDAENNIKTWAQTADASPAKAYDLGYDAADQLTSATLKDASSGALLKRYGYGYDKAGNRTAEQIDDASTAVVPNSVNELVSLQPGGALIFRGTTSETATVTVQAKPAATTADNKFEGQVPVGQGSTTVAVSATDPSGNTKTQNYQVSLTGATRTLSYDPNGNLTADGVRTYEWDARDRLAAVNEGTKRSEFTYDGFSRRTRIVEKLSGATTSDKRLMWVGRGIAEERDASGGTTTKRYFGQGVQQGSTSLYYAKDHLGSVRELVDTAGTVRARYDYDPYGRRTKTSGDLDADFGYTGHFEHAASGLKLAMYRTYDSNVGRWLSRDPIGLAGGINQYAYVENNPINFVDPLGLDMASFMTGVAEGALTAAAIGLAAGALGIGAVPLAILGGIGLAYSLYQISQSNCEDEIHQMLGGMLGGAAGGWGGFKVGSGARAPGNRTSSLPDYAEFGRHRNALDAPDQAQGYSLRNPNGEVLKYGETTRGESRYTKEFLEQENARMEFEAEGPKGDMVQWQTDKILQYTQQYGKRPPLNKCNR